MWYSKVTAWYSIVIVWYSIVTVWYGIVTVWYSIVTMWYGNPTLSSSKLATWNSSMTVVSVRSCIGPSSFRVKLMRVRLLHSMSSSCPSPCSLLTCTKPRLESRERARLPREVREEGGKRAIDMETVSVSLQYLEGEGGWESRDWEITDKQAILSKTNKICFFFITLAGGV